MLSTGAFSLNGVSSVHAFTATADGFAVVGNAYCGNEIIESSEECDDGNNNDGDGCDAFCVEE